MFNKLSFQRKFFLFYSGFVVLVLFTVISLFYYYTSGFLQSRSENEMRQTVEKLSARLDSMFKEINTISTQVLFSEEIQNILLNTPAADSGYDNYFDWNVNIKNEAQKVLIAINSPTTSVRRIGIFDGSRGYFSVGTASEDINAFHANVGKLEFKKEIQNAQSRSVILPPHKDSWLKDENAPMVVSFIREILSTYTGFKHLGYIEIQQPYSMLEDIFSTDDQSGAKVLVFNEKGELMYPVGKYDTQELSYYLSLKDKSGMIPEGDNGSELSYSSYSPYSRCTVIFVQQRKQLMAPVYSLRNMLIILGVIFIAFTLFIIYLITRVLSAPIREMRENLKTLTLENLSIHLSTNMGNNEVALLNEAFNKTFNRLKESLDQLIKARTEEAHAHMLALQAQINPHFLFNTLMCISGSASEAGSQKTVLMCSQLGNILRYTTSFKNEDIVLKDEFMHVENYLRLVKWRYEDCLLYSMEIDENMYNIHVPKLILQPIVENCFSHGFTNSTPPFEVRVKGHIENGKWFVDITDNGCGFDEEALQRIGERFDAYKKDTNTGKVFDKLEIGGMGMINIYMRLLLKYGENTIFSIGNHPGGGAAVRVGGILNVQDCEVEKCLKS